ncbi:aconitase X swivel domain-containing protein [Acuticoccus sp.]|uniref:aconitase X swivel domain-containing protein n=1 Tax=Acuticoccus sp. TaxID=1904378 RepID=UPI003B518139
MIVLACHPGIGPKVEGEALVARDNFSARYDLDRLAGVFSRPSHALVGQSYVGKILVLNTAKGGVATAWMLHEMASRGLAPLAILFNRANTILGQGAALADMAMVDRFEDGDVTTLIRTGERVTVDPDAGRVEVHRGA